MTKTTLITAVGRRKTAIASVRLIPAKSVEVTVNGMTPKDYFKTEDRARTVLESFKVAEAEHTYVAHANTTGGGLSAQADAVRHGIARALIKAEPKTRAALKKAGLLTRDPRAKERKKPGLKKARKAPQWSKR